MTRTSVITEEPNPYDGIYFFPDMEKYSATVAKRVIGVFDSLDEAIGARDRYIEYHTNKHALRETATYPPYYETRAFDAA